MKLIKSNLIISIFLCIALCGCSKEDKHIEGAFGFGESTSILEIESSSASVEDKFSIKDDVILSTEEIYSDINVSLSSLQQAKINEIEQNIKSSNSEITDEDVIELLNTDDFKDLSDLEKESLATDIVDKINTVSTSEILDSSLVYKHATSYETDEIIIDEEAPSRSYSEEELEVMHSEAESLYQQQQTAETFKFDD